MRANGAIPMLLAMLLAVGASGAAEAQTTTSWDVAGGYALTRDSTSDVTYPLGWNVSASARLLDWFRPTVEAGGEHQTIPATGGEARLSEHTLMGGVRASTNIGRFVEFGQILVGLLHASGSAFGVTSVSDNFSVQPGAGVDYLLTPHVAARVELDFRRFHGEHEVRLVTAIVYSHPRATE